VPGASFVLPAGDDHANDSDRNDREQMRTHDSSARPRAGQGFGFRYAWREVSGGIL